MKTRIILITSLIFIFYACTEPEDRKLSISQNQTLFSDIVNHKIVFPQYLKSLNLKRPIDIKKPILLTIVSTDCGDCIDMLMRWNNFDQLEKLDGYEIVFVAMGKSNNLLSSYLKTEDKKTFNILLDTTENFLRDNKLYAYYQKTIALDQYNRTKYIGDPTLNKYILDDLQFLKDGF